jgi:hypothetical protein
MDTQQILSDLRAELGRIEQAISALEALDGSAPPEPPQSKVISFEFGANKKSGRGRGISAAGRARIAAAARARWAKLKAAKAAKRAKAGRRISAEGRKRIAEAARKRWAAQRKMTAASPKKAKASAGAAR